MYIPVQCPFRGKEQVMGLPLGIKGTFVGNGVFPYRENELNHDKTQAVVISL